MGMFDEVNYEMNCPVCNEKITGFQTKSMNNLMETYEINELSDKATFYSICGCCGLYVEFFKHRCRNRQENKELFARLKNKNI